MSLINIFLWGISRVQHPPSITRARARAPHCRTFVFCLSGLCSRDMPNPFPGDRPREAGAPPSVFTSRLARAQICCQVNSGAILGRRETILQNQPPFPAGGTFRLGKNPGCDNTSEAALIPSPQPAFLARARCAGRPFIGNSTASIQLPGAPWSGKLGSQIRRHQENAADGILSAFVFTDQYLAGVELPRYVRRLCRPGLPSGRIAESRAEL